MQKEPTIRELQRDIHDVKDAVNLFATATEMRFQGIENRLDGIDGRLDGIDGRLDGIDGRLDGIDGKLGGMVTKDYLDEKLDRFREDIVCVLRKEFVR